MPDAAEAFAVLCNGQIKPDTVCSTRRGAIVNWLVTDRHTLVLANWTDAHIEITWDYERRSRGIEAKVISVLISERP